MNESIDSFIHALWETKKQIAMLTAHKNQIESYIKQQVFPEHVTEGTRTKTIGSYKLKMQYSVDRKIEMTSFEALRNNPLWQTVPQDVIRWRAELDTKVYKKLIGDQLLFINHMVTEKPKSPQLTIEVDDGSN